MKLPSNTLLDMLTYCRPTGGATEHDFITRYIVNLPGAERDPYGNWHVIIGESNVLWSCHTDTVHTQGGRQTLHMRENGIVGLSKRSKHVSSCLGADDTAGVYICREMILRGIPGHYIFHTNEEAGGIGSQDIAQLCPALLDGIDFAIAFDRKGTRDVITYQCGECCSDAFAWSLAHALDYAGLSGYRPSDRGIFTDTAQYVAIIGECTNLSIGYEHAHTLLETLDTKHVDKLLNALCRLDTSTLVSERLPHDNSYSQWNGTTTWGYTGLNNKGGIVSTPLANRHFKDADCLCQSCDLWYSQAESDADQFHLFCCEECERYAASLRFYGDNDDVDTGVPERSTSVYLDPQYEDVIDALDACKRERVSAAIQAYGKK